MLAGLFWFWIAGGCAAIGVLFGVAEVEETRIDEAVYVKTFAKSWFAFGSIIGILLGEIGQGAKETLEKIKEKKQSKG